MIIPVILSGGSGTRLWPLSTPEKPKQFLALVNERTLFQETLLRLAGLPGLADPIVVCNESHRALVAGQLDEIGRSAQAIVLEPAGRNTAPAIAVAALMAAAGSDPKGSDPTDPGGSDSFATDPVLLVLPADHVIADGAEFRAAVASAVNAAESGKLVTFGIVPTHAETGFGYIERGAVDGDWAEVKRFVEKPDAETANRYVESGRFLWNSGMFVFGIRSLVAELERFVPDILSACRAAVVGASVEDGCTRLGPAFLESPSDSIDYAVMEKTDRAAVVPLDAGWSDVGSWAALYEALARDGNGNALRGEVVALDVNNSLVLGGLRKIALLGLDNVAVIESGDSLLVMSMDSSQDVKRVQEKLETTLSRNKNITLQHKA
jgi:mannose-1-phosphate guanylyltransferase/mannose-6-phosphate isomerase